MKSTIATLILLSILATTFAVIPVSSQDPQRGPKIDKLRFKVVEGAGGGYYSSVTVDELYVDGFDASVSGWATIGASPYLDDVDNPVNYIEGTSHCSVIGFFSFEDTALEPGEFDSATIEAYAMTEDPEIDADIYLFAGPYSWVWVGSIEAGPYWSWIEPSYISGIPSYFLDPDLINELTMVIHYWTPGGSSGPGMRIDAVRLTLKASGGEWVPSPPVLAMQNCVVDVVTDLVRPQNIEKLDDEGHTITATPNFQICHIGFNIRPDQTYRRPEITFWPLADVEFRHSLVHGYDQEGIIASIYGFVAQPIQSLIPPAQGGWFNPSVPTHPYNPGDPFTSPAGEESSVGILKAAGYTFVDVGVAGVVDAADYWKDPMGDPLPTMRLYTPTYSAAPTSAQHVARYISDLAKIGLAGTAQNSYKGLVQEPMDYAAYMNMVFQYADFDAYMTCWSLGRFPTHLFDMTHSSQDSVLYPWRLNAPGINDPELDALTEVLKFSLDHNAKVAAAYEVQSRLYDPNYPSSAFAYMNMYSRNLFNAFKLGLCGIIDSPGFGSNNMWTFLNMYWRPHPNERIEDGKSTVVWSLNGEPERLNPLYAYTQYAWEILDRIYDPLVAINPYTLEDLPWLADSWTVTPTPTGMDVTFNLRNDIYWQDGNQYTAEDARFNWLFLRDNQIPRYTSTWEHILDVEVLGTYVVRVHLDVTSQWLLYDLIETAALLPPPVWGPLDGQPLPTILGYDPSTDTSPKPGVGPKFGTEECPTALYGTGPFVFQFYDPIGMYTDLYANRQYFKTTEEIHAQIVYMFHKIGDVNYDGIIDEIDLDRITASYGKVIGEPGYDPDADLNEDGIINGRDISLVSFYWYKVRAHPYPCILLPVRTIDKVLSASEGKLGDVVHVTLTVTVPPSETATVIDTLPLEFKYIEGTFQVDGTPTNACELSYTIATSGTHSIEFDVIVKHGYLEDREVCNVATATWYDEEGTVIDTIEDVECFTIHPFEQLRKNVGIPKADVVFAIDLTGSMAGEIATVKAQAANIMNSLAAQIADVQFGLISFMDYDGTYSTTAPGSVPLTYTALYGSAASGDYPYNLDQDITNNIALMTAQINALTLGWGADGPQDYTRIIHEAYNDTNLHWRTGAERILILFGDAVPHDTNFDNDNDGTLENTGGDPGRDAILGNADDLDFETEVANAAAANVHIMAVYSGWTGEKYPWTYMAAQTGGGYFELTEAAQIPDAIEGLIKAHAEEALTIKEKTEVQWAFVMSIVNPFDYTMKNVTIKDNFGAELEIDQVLDPRGDVNYDGSVDIIDLTLIARPYGSFQGEPEYDSIADLNRDGLVDVRDISVVALNYGLHLWLTGRSDKVHLYWYIGDLEPGETARIILLVSTDLNPAGHQEYTKPGIYEMNSGATLKFIDPEHDMQLSASTGSIYVTVLPLEDP